MLNFLLDITPDKSQLLITIKLAGILREKKQEADPKEILGGLFVLL